MASQTHNSQPFFVTINQLDCKNKALTYLGYPSNISQFDFEHECGQKGIFPGFKLVLEKLGSNQDDKSFYIGVTSLFPSIRHDVIKHFGFTNEVDFNQYCGVNGIFPGFRLSRNQQDSSHQDPLPQQEKITTPIPLKTEPITPPAPKKSNLPEKGFVFGYGKGHMWVPSLTGLETDDEIAELKAEIFGDEAKNVHRHKGGYYILRTSAYNHLVGKQDVDIRYLGPVKLCSNELEDEVELEINCENKADRPFYEKILTNMFSKYDHYEYKDFLSKVKGIPDEASKELFPSS